MRAAWGGRLYTTGTLPPVSQAILDFQSTILAKGEPTTLRFVTLDVLPDVNRWEGSLLRTTDALHAVCQYPSTSV